MRFILMTFVFSVFIFLGSCSHEDTASSIKTVKVVPISENVIVHTDVKEEVNELDAEVALFESLQAKYKSKGFESFCILKGDLDSIFLISDYMANVIYGEDNFSAAKISLGEWIEKDKLEAYYRLHNLNSKEVSEDLTKFAVNRNRLCNEYLERRHQSDRDEINNVMYLQLAKEAHEKYTP